MYEGMLAETIAMRGHGGDDIPAYYARPLGAGPFPGVVVVHHMPGWDQETKETARTFAAMGYAALVPHLHHRDAPGASWSDAAAASRAAGGVPDERAVGDIGAGMEFLRAQPYANGKVGAIGYCSGGRQVYLAACQLPLDAAVDCYGGNVIMKPEALNPRQPVSPIDHTPDLRCALLGLFGENDANPDRAQVEETRAVLEKYGKTFEFHSYPDAGHAFFSPRRPAYNPDAAREGWARIREWFGEYLGADAT